MEGWRWGHSIEKKGKTWQVADGSCSTLDFKKLSQLLRFWDAVCRNCQGQQGQPCISEGQDVTWCTAQSCPTCLVDLGMLFFPVGRCFWKKSRREGTTATWRPGDMAVAVLDSLLACGCSSGSFQIHVRTLKQLRSPSVPPSVSNASPPCPHQSRKFLYISWKSCETYNVDS